MMNFEEFCSYVKNEVLNKMDRQENMTVSVRDIRKNNGVCLKGLVISQAGKNICPTIYLEPYYEEMTMEHLSKEDVLTKIVSDYINASKKDIDFDITVNLREDKIVGVLVNQERNMELLKDIPHILIGDSLAVIFKYLIDVSVEGISSITITDYLAELKGYETDRLMELALVNTPKIMGYSFRSMISALGELAGLGLEEDFSRSGFPMYVLSNKLGQFGAFALLYPETRDVLFEKFGNDLLVIPSSIHELIVCPADNELVLSDIDNVVREVNETQLKADELLADRAFVMKRDGSDDISKFVSYYAPKLLGVNSSKDRRGA